MEVAADSEEGLPAYVSGLSEVVRAFQDYSWELLSGGGRQDRGGLGGRRQHAAPGQPDLTAQLSPDLVGRTATGENDHV
ncbi:MAG: hypothetical protein WKF51_12275 [Geodermatophilaceae bacterium]